MHPNKNQSKQPIAFKFRTRRPRRFRPDPGPSPGPGILRLLVGAEAVLLREEQHFQGHSLPAPVAALGHSHTPVQVSERCKVVVHRLVLRLIIFPACSTLATSALPSTSRPLRDSSRPARSSSCSSASSSGGAGRTAASGTRGII